MGAYLLINYSQPSEVDLLLPLDTAIPYWPWSVSIYFTLYVMYLAAALTLDAHRYSVMLLSILGMTLFSFICFILFTSHYPRPHPDQWSHSLWKPVIDLMVFIDPPGNTCPSLHVSTSLYVGWKLKEGPKGKFWLVWGLLVSLSTLTLKQHFVLDWVCGAFLVIATLVIERLLNRGAEVDQISGNLDRGAGT